MGEQRDSLSHITVSFKLLIKLHGTSFVKSIGKESRNRAGVLQRDPGGLGSYIS
jgi:hypothetical protein